MSGLRSAAALLEGVGFSLLCFCIPGNLMWCLLEKAPGDSVKCVHCPQLYFLLLVGAPSDFRPPSG